MSASTPRLLNADTTAAVILGASDWTAAGLGPAPSFRRSASGIKRYLFDSNGLHLDPELVLDLFDDKSSPSEQLTRLCDTLDELLRERREGGRPVADLLIYYVGHGCTDDQGRLTLLVRQSRKNFESETGIKAEELARILKVAAPQQRRLVVLDCCFSEAAARAFVGQGALDQAVAAIAAKDIAQALPTRGGVLLCSSPVGEISIGKPDAERTLFTGAVIQVLRNGVAKPEPLISFSDLCDEAHNVMVGSFGATAPRPVLHAFNQTQGDLTKLPAFLNRAALLAAEERAQREKEQKVRLEAEKSARLAKEVAEREARARGQIEREEEDRRAAEQAAREAREAAQREAAAKAQEDKQEMERGVAEEAARLTREATERAAAAKAQMEKEESDRRHAQEAARLAKEAAEREAAAKAQTAKEEEVRRAAEKAARLAKEAAELEAIAKVQKGRQKAREDKDRLEAEEAARLAKETAEREVAAKPRKLKFPRKKSVLIVIALAFFAILVLLSLQTSPPAPPESLVSTSPPASGAQSAVSSDTPASASQPPVRLFYIAPPQSAASEVQLPNTVSTAKN